MSGPQATPRGAVAAAAPISAVRGEITRCRYATLNTPPVAWRVASTSGSKDTTRGHRGPPAMNNQPIRAREAEALAFLNMHEVPKVPTRAPGGDEIHRSTSRMKHLLEAAARLIRSPR
jgi:hypothetical protein